MSLPISALAKQGPVVLAVDDDPGILRIVEMLLSRNGYTVRTAPSAEKALVVLKTIRPAVLISDVQMPGMTGYDLCQVVKRDDRLKEIPVIFLTAQGSPRDYKTGHESGAVMYMVKPFKPEKLLQMVRMVAPPAQIHGEPSMGA
jgi:two-component system sensor histidine kinase ChiS